MLQPEFPAEACPETMAAVGRLRLAGTDPGRAVRGGARLWLSDLGPEANLTLSPTLTLRPTPSLSQSHSLSLTTDC